ncbi:protein kinase [Myxococcota bacterium]|nr:protein kinase [Myxococcota bacterium]
MAALSLGPFAVLQPLGRGGMAEVWRGRHQASGAEVAIKVMTAENLRSEVFQRAFAAEVQAVASLDHPHVIRLYDVGTVGAEVARRSEDRLAEGSPYLVMELADGGNLTSDPPPADWAVVRQVLLDLLSALAHAHARGVIHRDIKPGNVLWGRPAQAGGAARPVLSDFGIAHAGDEGGRGGPTWGTPAYMAPERFTLEWRDLGPWTDLYSVGCLAFTLLRGRPPFKGQVPTEAMQAHLYRPVPSLRARCPVPEGLDAWLRGLLAKAPADRFRCAADAARALQELGEAPEQGSAREEPSSDTEPQPGSSGASARGRPRDGSPASTSIGSVHPSPDVAEATWTDGVFDPAEGSVEHRRSTRGTAPRRRRLAAPPPPEDWRPTGPAELPADIPGGGLRLFGLRVVRLADREAERDRLWEALSTVRRRGRPKGMLLRGPIGTGKTRLAGWLAERAAELGAALPLRADHGPGEVVPGLARMVAEHLRVGGLGRRALRSRVLAWLQVQGVHDDWLARELVAVASQGAGLRLLPEEEPRDLRTSTRRLVELLARDRPVVLHLDDVAWGPASLSFVADLLEPGRRVPVLLVLTARDEALASMPAAASALRGLVEDGQLEELAVGPLPEAHRIELVRNLLGVEECLARRVAEGTAGNPLFAVTLVRDWVARDLLVESPAGLRAASAEPPVPPDLVALWDQRLLDLLRDEDDEARRALEIAAALGEAVAQEEWSAACEQALVAPPAGLVPSLVAEHLAARSNGGWRFVHDVVRERLLQGARERGRLVEVHGACVAMLDERHPDAGPAIRERRGRHLAAAEQPGRAAPELLAGASARQEQGDPAASLLVLDEVERALARLAHHEGTAARVEAHLLRARALLDLGQPDAARAFARQAEATSHGATEPETRRARGHALTLLGWVALVDGQPADAARHLAEARALLAGQANRAEQAELDRLQGELLRMRGELEGAEEHLAAAAEAFGALERILDWAVAVTSLARVAIDRGDLDHAEGLLQSALDRCRALRHRRGEADVLLVGGHCALARGDLALADQRYRSAQAIYQRLGSRRLRSTRLGRARVALALGRLDEAARLLDAVRADRPRSRLTRARLEATALLLAARRGDWTAFDLGLPELAGLLLRAGLGLVELRGLGQEVIRAAAISGQADRAARARALLGS